MPKLYFIALLSILLFSKTLLLNGQTTILRLEPQNTRPIDGSMDYATEIGSKKGKFWTVFSDRDNNPSYNKPDQNSGVKRNLQFLDNFYVIDEEGEFVHIARGDIAGSLGTLSNMQDYGWISKRRLIVWTKCVETKARITQKAILLNKIDTVSKTDFADANRAVLFYSDPEIDKGKKTADSRLFEVFYVYKTSPTSVLLGKSTEIIDPLDARSSILGWADRRKVVFWDNRVAIEPNWLETAINERKEKGFTPVILDKIRSAEVLKGGQKLSEDHIYLDLTNQRADRMDGYEWRFPVFNEFKNAEEQGILSVGAMGKIVTKAGEINPEIRASALKKYEKGREQQKNINIIFVLDATDGMKAHYSAVSQAIQTAQSKLQEGKNSIKYGAVAYRNSGAGKNATEVKTLNNNPEKLLEFINQLSTSYPANQSGTGLYNGIKTAIQDVGLNSKHTNILILIGREGDIGDGQVNENELTELLFKNNCHLVAIQAKSGEADTYQDFTYQAEGLVLKSAQRRYEKYKHQSSRGLPPKLDEVKAGDYQKFMLRNTAAMGQLIFPNINESILNDNLENEITQIIIHANTRVNGLLNVLDRLFRGSGATKENDLSEFNASVLFFVIDQAELTEEEANSFSFNDFQGSKEGFTTREINGLQYPIFKSVLFLDMEELSAMHENFRALDDPNGSLSEQREAMVRAWQSLLRSYEGGKDANALKGMTMSEINEKVFGLPGSSKLLGDLRLEQIHDLPDDKFQKYVSGIRSKRQRLLGIMEEKDYKFSFMSYGRRYFWIDEDLLP
jgi:hypothetical protein